MKKKKNLPLLLMVLLLLASCEKDGSLMDTSTSLMNTTWVGVETFKCTKPEGCIEQQIIKFYAENNFSFQYIDGHRGTDDTIIYGTYTYSHPELIFKAPEGTLTAMLINENNICLDSGIDCKETSSEFLVKQ